MRKLILAPIVLLLCYFSCFSQEPLETVNRVDLRKYSGKWYEICHLPAHFLDGCSCISATYSLNSKGYVNVYNKCRKSNGKWTSIKGKAFAVSNSWNSKLKVQFFWPFRADYYILELADDYSYAVVGEPRRKYLWILSRTLDMDLFSTRNWFRNAEIKGFRLNIWSSQARKDASNLQFIKNNLTLRIKTLNLQPLSNSNGTKSSCRFIGWG